jgi:ribosomal protein S18 acetylase RimI-like enzyme
MQVRAIVPPEFEVARKLLLANGWSDHRVSDPESFRLLLERAQCCLVAEAEGQIVGFLRALTDNLSNGYISMVVVAESHRKRGIGTALVRTAMGSDPNITWVLRAGREGVSGFYERLGFVKSVVAMERVRAGKAAA